MNLVHTTRSFFVCCLFLLLVGCLVTVGEIRDSTFYYEDYFSAKILDNDWEVIRQQKQTGDPLFPTLYPTRYSSSYQISFAHKKSNGFIGVIVSQLSEVGKQRSLDIIADSVISQFEGMKLSQKTSTVDGIEAIEVIESGKKMMKLIIFKTGDLVYYVTYSNTPTFFDQYLTVFDKFISDMKINKRWAS